MTAFDRIKSGIDALDGLFDSIRLGDNVVWQLADLDEFRVGSDRDDVSGGAVPRRVREAPYGDDGVGQRAVVGKFGAGADEVVVALDDYFVAAELDVELLFQKLRRLKGGEGDDVVFHNF